MNLEVHSITPEQWEDVESLFGESGGYAGCWCMFWRLDRTQFKAQKYDGNKQTLKHLIYSGNVLGLLGYVDGQAVAWCSVGPREQYIALEKSRVLKRVDDEVVWSITCFFVIKSFRRKGIMIPMLKAAIDYAQSQGAKLIEGYPIEIAETVSTPGGYMGFASAFRQVGFVEVKRVSETQILMRYYIDGQN